MNSKFPIDVINLYQNLNSSVVENYDEEIRNISTICQGIDSSDLDEKYKNFFKSCCNTVLGNHELEKSILDGYIEETPFQKLMEDNQSYYNEFLGQNYKTSYANPAFAAEIFGLEEGRILSYIYSIIKSTYKNAFKHDIFSLWKSCVIFLNVYEQIASGKHTVKSLKKSIYDFKLSILDEELNLNIKENFTPENDFYNQIVQKSDLNDVRYLFRFGMYVSENEVKTAQFLSGYDDDKLDTLTDTIVNGYVEGFIRDNKDMSKRHNVRIACVLGQERITEKIIEKLKNHKLNGFIFEVDTTSYNKQFEYDLQFANALYLDEGYSKHHIANLEAAYENNSAMVRDYSGILLVEKFGEEPFSPVPNDKRLTLSKDQLAILNNQRNKSNQISKTYIPEEERSFCIVAFPIPEIGDNFEEIFEDIMKINMLQNSKYEPVQQSIIDALDKGDYVHVKGKGSNETDIRVSMHKLEEPEKQTNFVNCVADVNIPLGEVFTSPLLSRTNGTIHVEDIYLDGFRYYNLKMVFEDGYIKDYSCTNFDDDKKNREYIRENLLLPHDSLPMGEFAIGTNTLAYSVAQKYGIMDKLPILIIEKMGPHFAIGDTCFSWSEDNAVFNSDGKEIIARDNELSLLRKTNLDKAYTNKHTDITIPYSSLDSIHAVTGEGERIAIIEDSKFVVSGSEILNKYL